MDTGSRSHNKKVCSQPQGRSARGIPRLANGAGVAATSYARQGETPSQTGLLRGQQGQLAQSGQGRWSMYAQPVPSEAKAPANSVIPGRERLGVLPRGNITGAQAEQGRA